MKTLYKKMFIPGFVLGILFLLFQSANAKIVSIAASHYATLSHSTSVADTSKKRLVYKKQKRKKIDRDEERENDKLEDGVDDDIQGREHQDFLRTKDPHLNVVPVARLIEAKRTKDQLARSPSININALAGTAPPSLSTLQWNERGPSNVGGRTRALIFDLGDAAHGYKKVFAGGVGGGLWYTNDITATTISWTKINDFFDNIAISCIAQNPVNPLEIYAGTGEGFYNGDAIQGLGVWKSADGGASWVRLTSTSIFTNVNAILVDKNGSVYIAGHGYGVQKSSNGGSTFTQVIPSLDGADLQLAANGDIYASTGDFSAGRIFIADFGVNGANTGDANTWTNISPASNGTITPTTTSWWRIKLATAPGNANIVYALFEGVNTYALSSLQQYNKATNTWTVKTVPGGTVFNNDQSWYSIAAAVDPNNENVLYTGSLDAARSIDGGTTWNTVSQWYVGQVSGLSASQFVHADHHAYVFAPGSSDRFLMGTDGGVFSTQNATNNVAPYASFIPRNTNYNVTQFYSVALHPTDYNFALAGAQDNSTQVFKTSGINATTDVIGGDGAFCFIDQLNGNVQIGSYVYSNYYFSTDKGVTFNSATSSNYGQFINPADYDSNTKSLYTGSYMGYYFRVNGVPSTSDVQYVHVNGFASANVMAVTASPVTANRVFFGLDNGTVVRVDNANVGTENASVVLSPNPSITNVSVSCIAVDPLSEDHLLVSYFNYGIVSIYETKNASAATPVWTQVEGNLPDMPVRWVMFHPDDSKRALIATELGVWSTDALNGASTTWNPTNSGLANTEVDMLKYRAADRTLAAATHGRGLYTTTLPKSTISSLAGLTISTGTLSPAFATGTLAYNVSVANTVTDMTVTPTVTDPLSTVKVNGTTVASGSASASIPLAAGQNNIAVVVTAQDGVTTQTYTVKVTKGGSTNASLSAITLSSGTLSPVFAAGTKAYTASVSNATSTVTVTPTAGNPAATIKINGVTSASGVPSAAIPLVVGTNAINITLTAQDGVTVKTYTVTVTRAKSSDAGLASIALTAGTLSPAFSTGVTSYTVAEINTTNSIKITPATSTTGATVKVNGTTVASGAQSQSIPLNIGANTVTIAVTAQDGATMQTYTITVNRTGSNNATLSAVTLSSGTLTPVFAAGTRTYTATVTNGTGNITITPTAGNPAAVITVNGKTVTSGHASAAVPLAIGQNVINTVVTAQDGVTVKTYSVTVTRPGSTNASLSALVLSSGTLSPAFAVGTVTYTASVANTVSSITVKPTAGNPAATIKVNGTVVASGTASAALPLVEGPNVINTVVTAQDGTTIKTYKVTVTRLRSSNAALASLAISVGTLSPAFSTTTTAYTVTEAYATSTVKFTPTSSNAGATIKVNGIAVVSGADSRAIPLNFGQNTITTAVTAADGVTVKNYITTVTRTGSNNATLSALSLTNCTLTPVFAAGTLSYTSSVANSITSTKVTPTAGNAASVIKVNGTTVATGAASGTIALSVGVNTITTLVTAQDGSTTKSYVVKVTRASSGLAAEYAGDATAVAATEGLVVHQNVSPNGDGNSDVLIIDGIAQYPDNKLSIMSRSGALMFEMKGYNNTTAVFDGHTSRSKKMLLAGTYFYTLEYKDNGQTKHKTGFIVLKY